jgi:hypothetical protein
MHRPKAHIASAVMQDAFLIGGPNKDTLTRHIFVEFIPKAAI